jgi:cell division transport system permease protein
MRFLYILNEGLSGFRRAKLAAAGSVMTIAIALMMLGLYAIVSTNTSRLVQKVREKVEMEAFLQEPVSAQRIAEIREEVSRQEGVERVELVTKEEAARIFKEEFGQDIDRVLDFNPLPPSLRIFLKESHRTSAAAESLSRIVGQIPGVDEVVYHARMLEFIEKQTGVLYAIGLALGILIGVSSVFLVANTIRLAIYARRASVQTMKLVGASRWVIRAPFIVEGALQGFLGGAIAAGVIYYLIRTLLAYMSEELAQFLVVEPSFYLLVVIVGVSLGLFGSAISVRKFIGETVA